jgi:hypothetical protein
VRGAAASSLVLTLDDLFQEVMAASGCQFGVSHVASEHLGDPLGVEREDVGDAWEVADEFHEPHDIVDLTVSEAVPVVDEDDNPTVYFCQSGGQLHALGLERRSGASGRHHLLGGGQSCRGRAADHREEGGQAEHGGRIVRHLPRQAAKLVPRRGPPLARTGIGRRGRSSPLENIHGLNMTTWLSLSSRMISAIILVIDVLPLPHGPDSATT